MPPSRHDFPQLTQVLARSTFANATATNNGTDPESTIAPFATALNGVDQPKNNLFKAISWWSLGVLAMLILAIRMFERYQKHQRHMAAMNLPAEHQRYWAENLTSWWKVKKHLLYAPLGKKRHNREYKLSPAINMGTLPSRLHTILLTLYLLSNLIYCIVLDYNQPDKYSVIADLRGRSGVLAIVNMIPLVILAGRNNPLIPILQISFDTYNLIHRWMGRIVVYEAVIHTIAWAYVKHAATGWSGIGMAINTDPFIGYGSVGTIAMVVIFFTSPSAIRHAFYETFLNVHMILAFVAIIGVYIHCQIAQLPQLPFLRVVILLWFGERIARLVRIVYYNYSRKGWTNASIKALPGNACRVTMHLPKQHNIKPGTHAYLRFATLNAWESHPFSIAWVEDRPTTPTNPFSDPWSEKDPESRAEMTTDVSFVIHAQSGLTKRLFDKAKASSPRTLTLKAAFEGPYAGHHSLDSYGHAVLFAGSSGITHQIPYVKHLIQGFTDGRIATRKVLLVWIVRDSNHLEWVRPWMDEILRMPKRRDILTIKLFVTRPSNPREIVSPSATVQMYPGRPNIDVLLQTEVRNQTGAMCVTVCGPGGLADNVRGAVRDLQHEGSLDLIEESFTW